ncbi:MAG: ABC transporter ATP-binding protein [Desulfotalea sp.]
MAIHDNILFSVEEISLKYPRADVFALGNVSFNISRGECFGLIGANGAGKTSLISIISSLIKPSSGKVFFRDHSNEGLKSYKTKIGIVPQDIALYGNLTGEENLRYFGAMYNIPRAKLDTVIKDRLIEFGLYERRKDFVCNYSGGMQRRLNILAGILHEPELIILDEPLVGVDVRSRNVILQAFKNLRASGISIVYTSHHMKEVEELCDQIVVLNLGCVVALGKPEELLKKENSEDLYELFCKLTAEGDS